MVLLSWVTTTGSPTMFGFVRALAFGEFFAKSYGTILWIEMRLVCHVLQDTHAHLGLLRAVLVRALLYLLWVCSCTCGHWAAVHA